MPTRTRKNASEADIADDKQTSGLASMTRARKNASEADVADDKEQKIKELVLENQLLKEKLKLFQNPPRLTYRRLSEERIALAKNKAEKEGPLVLECAYANHCYICIHCLLKMNTICLFPHVGVYKSQHMAFVKRQEMHDHPNYDHPIKQKAMTADNRKELYIMNDLVPLQFPPLVLTRVNSRNPWIPQESEEKIPLTEMEKMEDIIPYLEGRRDAQERFLYSGEIPHEMFFGFGFFKMATEIENQARWRGESSSSSSKRMASTEEDLLPLDATEARLEVEDSCTANLMAVENSFPGESFSSSSSSSTPVLKRMASSSSSDTYKKAATKCPHGRSRKSNCKDCCFRGR